MSKIKMFLVAGVEMWFKKNNANFKSKKSADFDNAEIVNILEENYPTLTIKLYWSHLKFCMSDFIKNHLKGKKTVENRYYL